ncbi:hypothetical protein [Marinirhabdus gelatinilytica]|uniref:Uncharacterized protein n=1 Tax=Marinirhabdus gelatinilytica TaxID=1703343 RepID=A0A370QLE1_9FLAO|nr:hypothetical protein [Marinirhabdus gelatinilytica]RDK89183.1 hypothetical protein C8D94_1011064 [Marinirhabdus gelatinilytica]
METKNRQVRIEKTFTVFFGNFKQLCNISEKIMPQKIKKTLLTSITIFISFVMVGCPVCENNQPKGFENITHGQGPDGNLDYIIMFVAIIIVGFTLIMSIKYLIKPKEKNKDHIKNLVVNENNLTD